MSTAGLKNQAFKLLTGCVAEPNCGTRIREHKSSTPCKDGKDTTFCSQKRLFIRFWKNICTPEGGLKTLTQRQKQTSCVGTTTSSWRCIPVYSTGDCHRQPWKNSIKSTVKASGTWEVLICNARVSFLYLQQIVTQNLNFRICESSSFPIHLPLLSQHVSCCACNHTVHGVLNSLWDKERQTGCVWEDDSINENQTGEWQALWWTWTYRKRRCNAWSGRGAMNRAAQWEGQTREHNNNEKMTS